MDDDELVENLRDQGVTAVRHMYQNRDNQKSKTRTMVLTFNTSHLPRSIKAGRYLNIASGAIHSQTHCDVLTARSTVTIKLSAGTRGVCQMRSALLTVLTHAARGPHCVNCQGDAPRLSSPLCPSAWVSFEKQKVARLPCLSA